MTPSEQNAVIQGYITAYNSFNVEKMLGFVHPEVVFKNVAGGEVNATATGFDEFREMAEQSRSLFSSRRQQITGIESTGDTVTVHIDYEGVLASDLPNGMKAGDTLKLEGRSVFEFLDGKLYRITDYS
jgi:ketosteroid isomerase-like protein